MVIGKEIREARLALGLSQDRLARASGVSQVMIWRLEQGSINLNPELSIKLTAILGVKLPEVVDLPRAKP